MNQTAFLHKFARELLKHEGELHKTAVILPARRAAVFLRRELSSIIEKPVFAPYITTIDEFIMDAVGWKQESNARLMFSLYDAYSALDIADKDDFSDFSQWAGILLSDLNEIDRYLVDPKQLFTYLADVERIKQWNLTPGESTASDMVQQYLRLWEAMPELYTKFTESLKNRKRTYQGLAFREMAENMDHYLPRIKGEYNQVFFGGFSAMNRAEEQIMLRLEEESMADFYWDIDEYYFGDPVHEAGKFLRSSKLVRRLKEKQRLHWLSNDLREIPKKIRIIGAAGNTAQMVAANDLAADIAEDEVEQTAIVLADESQLQAFLNNLAEPVNDLNVTMGIPLRSTPVAGFIGLLWEMLIHQERSKHKDTEGKPRYYFQHWDDLLTQPLFHAWLDSGETEELRNNIRSRNMVYLTFDELHEQNSSLPNVLKELLLSPGKSISEVCRQFGNLCEELKILLPENDAHAKYLFAFYKVFQQLSQLFEDYQHLLDLRTARMFYQELLQTETVDLRGEPLKGLQLMGMLETRTLNFKRIIMTSVNEDILPKGRSQNSLIPFDVRSTFGLPTYIDKDAVFAYHFYRLLQSAEDITLIYNSRHGSFGGGEASRFIAQLEYELIPTNKDHNITREVMSPDIRIPANIQSIEKTPEVMERLRALAERGISPSALIDYINDPVEFYYKRVLGIAEADEVEEVIGYDTQGNVLHEILQDYYSVDEDHQKGHLQTISNDLPAFGRTGEELRNEVVSRLNAKGLYQVDQGKNLLVRETLTSMLRSFLRTEKEKLESLKAEGLQLEILGLEKDLTYTLTLHTGETVKIKGVADRIQRVAGEVCVVDYKTGGVNPQDVSITELDDLRQPLKKNKSLQLMAYAYLYLMNNPECKEVQAAILSLRNTNAWLMPLKVRRDPVIKRDMTESFEVFLTEIFMELFDETLPFARNTLSLEEDE